MSDQNTDQRRFLIAGLGLLAGFVLTTVVVFSGVFQSTDNSVALALNNAFLGSALNQLMVDATDYGREYFWIGVVAVMLLLGKSRTRTLALELAVLFVVGIIVGDSLKLLLFRERPFEALAGIVQRAASDTDSSFPSGHALIVSIGAGFVLSAFKKKSVAVLLAFEAAIVCYSRVYLGAHYPTDILAGVFVGLSIVLLGSLVLEKYFRPTIDRASRLLDRVLREGFFDI
jgi:undecaprenyl-diphosphatase